VKSDQPVLVAEDRGAQWAAWCPHCRRHHLHGPGVCHRVAHCRDGPFVRTGYWLVLTADTP